jgi:hypothetical protein
MSFLIEKDQTRLLASLFLFLEKSPPDRQSRLVFFVSLKNARQNRDRPGATAKRVGSWEGSFIENTPPPPVLSRLADDETADNIIEQSDTRKIQKQTFPPSCFIFYFILKSQRVKNADVINNSSRCK